MAGLVLLLLCPFWDDGATFLARPEPVRRLDGSGTGDEVLLGMCGVVWGPEGSDAVDPPE